MSRKKRDSLPVMEIRKIKASQREQRKLNDIPERKVLKKLPKNRELLYPNFILGSKEYLRNAYLISAYGITLTEYTEILKSQNYCCALCGLHESRSKRSLSVDHCHKSGKIRGILCDRCNHGLGHFADNVEVMKKAIKYLVKNS